MKPSSKRKPNRFKYLIRQFHRYSGLVLALIIVLLCLTGFALNHIQTFGLHRKPITQPWLLSFYTIEADAHTPLSGSPETSNFSKPQGTAVYQEDGSTYWIVASSDSLTAYTANTDTSTQTPYIIHWSLDALDGLPANINALYQQEQMIVLVVNSDGADSSNLEYYQLNPQQQKLLWITDPKVAGPHNTINLPAELQVMLSGVKPVPDITWERLLRDLHSGRLFKLSTLAIDFITGFILLLAFSGVWIALKRR